MEIDQASTLALPKQQSSMPNVMSKDPNTTDVALFGGLQAGGQQTHQPVRTNKAVLEASSQFFITLFADNAIEYTLKKVSHESLQLIVQVLNQEEVVVANERICSDVEFACDIVRGCKNMLLDDMASTYEDILIKHHTTVKNFTLLCDFTHEFPNLLKLTTAVEQLLAKSLKEVIADDKFLQNNGLDRLLRMMVFDSTPLEDRFSAAFAWIDYDLYPRRIFSREVLLAIPLPREETSRTAWMNASFVKSLDPCGQEIFLELVAKCTKIPALSAEQNSIPQASVATTNGISSSQTDINTLFCISQCKDQSMFLKYDVNSKTWLDQKNDDITWRQEDGAACVLGDQLVLFAGKRTGRMSRNIYNCLITSENPKWKENDCKMPYKSANWIACGIGYTAYVCGDRMDFYEWSVGKKHFETMQHMAVERSGKSITSAPTFDAVYFAGGKYSNKSYAREIEKFDIARNAWLKAGNAKTGRENPGLAICGDYLYLIGGDAVGNAVEKVNIRTGEASAMPNLINKRRRCQAVALNRNVIWAFGDNSSVVETCDVRDGIWIADDVVKTMSFDVSGYSLAWK